MIPVAGAKQFVDIGVSRRLIWINGQILIGNNGAIKHPVFYRGRFRGVLVRHQGTYGGICDIGRACVPDDKIIAGAA